MKSAFFIDSSSVFQYNLPMNKEEGIAHSSAVRRIADLESMLRSSKERIAALGRGIVSKDKEIKAKDKEIAAKDGKIKDKEREIAEKERAIAEAKKVPRRAEAHDGQGGERPFRQIVRED